MNLQLDPNIGGIVTITSKTDMHSPVLLLNREQLLEDEPSLRGVPWTVVDIDDVPNETRNKFILYSLPTTVWLSPGGDPVVRIVGAVNPKKLGLELEKAIDKL